ncbi:MAG: RNA 2',3'-cyclic phosphodiesterase [Deltaproteobacteria bacterium]|nr:RNA 2',3'-cyclic phosphodiesterase [Deltaproteobacteria bacterium]
MPDEKNIRAFLALEIPEDVQDAVSRLQEKLKRDLGGRISWTQSQGRHLTLKFFGNVSAEDVKHISSAVDSRTQLHRPLNLSIGELGVFPNPQRPRVLWCGVAGEIEKLCTLQKQLDGDFTGLDFPAEDRSYRAHLTLARMKDPRDVSGVEKALTQYKAFSAGEFSGKELVLFQSKLSPRGAVYTKLAVFPLAG